MTLIITLTLTPPSTHAQTAVPPGIHVTRAQIPLYRDTPDGQIIDGMITFSSATGVPGAPGHQVMRLGDFNMRSFKDADTNLIQLIALAPQCQMDLDTKIGSDPGPLQIFTPVTNFYVEGRGYYCDQSQHLLVISNDVATRIAKNLLKSPLFGTSSNAPTNQFVRIFADYCHYNWLSNIVDYVGHVRVFDPSGDSQSRAMTIYLTTNNAIHAIREMDDVTIDLTNRGSSTGDYAYYLVTNGAEHFRLSGHAVWHNGLEEAHAGQFDYDSLAHTLHATNEVHVHWPNPPASTNGFVELSSDIAFLQWPLTNGPIEKMTANGHVAIFNQSDQSHATGDAVLYYRPNDSFVLTGSPLWWNSQTRVSGDVLNASVTNKIYRAKGHADFTTRDLSNTNRTLHITCDHLQFTTNLAEFHQDVVAKVLEKGALQDTLWSRDLTADMTSNKIRMVVARGDVRGETIPDASGVTKTLSCQTLTLWRNIVTGLTERILGEDHVVVHELGGAAPATNTLHADTVHVFFLPYTNRVDYATAHGGVIIDQVKTNTPIHATSDHAVFNPGTNGQVTLTGHPFAENSRYQVTNATKLVWQPQSNRFAAIGLFQVLPLPTNSIK